MNHFPNASEDGVEQARLFVTELVRAFIMRGKSDNTTEAISSVAHYCRVNRSDVRRFYQPSRGPKAVSVRLWNRLWRGYASYLRRELADIENRLAALDKMDSAARGDLVVEAQDLIARIKASL